MQNEGYLCGSRNAPKIWKQSPAQVTIGTAQDGRETPARCRASAASPPSMQPWATALNVEKRDRMASDTSQGHKLLMQRIGSGPDAAPARTNAILAPAAVESVSEDPVAN